MSKLLRTLQLSLFIALTSASLACAASPNHETTGQYVDDSVITTRVKAAIFNESSLKTLQINVKTYKGQTQLSGFVDSSRSADRAGEVAAQVEGVVAVKNDLLVK